VRSLAAISLGSGMPCAASVPHSIVTGFKALVSMALEADYTFKQGELMIAMAKDPSAFAALA